MIAFALTLIFMMSSNIDRYRRDQNVLISERLAQSNTQICSDNSEQFCEILDYLDTLNFAQEPNYDKISFILQKIVLNEGRIPKVPKKIKKKKAKTIDDGVKSKPLTQVPKLLKKVFDETVEKDLNFDDEVLPVNEQHGFKNVEEY